MRDGFIDQRLRALALPFVRQIRFEIAARFKFVYGHGLPLRHGVFAHAKPKDAAEIGQQLQACEGQQKQVDFCEDGGQRHAGDQRQMN